MSGKLMLGVLLTALVVFFWSGISHMLLPWWEASYGGFSNEADVSTALMQNTDADGIYFLPDIEPGDEAGAQRMATGPMAFVVLTRGGMDPASPRPYILQFVFNIVIAAFLARLFVCIGPQAFSVRLRMVVVIAVIAGLMTHMPYWAWYGFAGTFTLVSMVDIAVGWFLGGLVLARFAK